MSEEGFHEIELKGKQLVFLFMAATVVSVVIFLCGVMVGRGVRAPLAAQQPAAVLDEAADLTLTGGASQMSLSNVIPASTGETLTSDRVLDPPEPVFEPLSARAAEPASSAPPAPPEPKPAAVPAVRQSTPESGDGNYVVQVVATKTRAEADGIMRRLTVKGYTAFVTPVDSTSKSAYKFRVRVGKYTRREAESVAQRLTKEEQFKPWITR